MDIKQYLDRFSNELYSFLSTLDELMPTKTLQKILNNFDKLDTIKLVNVYRNQILKYKKNLTSHDVTIFSQPIFIIPEIDISFYWNNLPQNHQNTIIEKLLRLIVCSNIINEKLQQHNAQHVTKKSESTQLLCNKTQDQNEHQKSKNLFNGVGDDNVNISTETFVQESTEAQLDGNPLLSKLTEQLNVDQLSEQLNKIDGESINKITDGIGQYIDPHVKNPEVKTFLKGAMCNIVDKLKTHDFKNEGLFNVVKQISSEMADQLSSDSQNMNCPPEQLLESAQSILHGLGVGDNLTPENLNTTSLMTIATQLMSSINQNNNSTPPSNNSTPQTNNDSVAMMDLVGKFIGL
jgi:hypothetical protein